MEKETKPIIHKNIRGKEYFVKTVEEAKNREKMNQPLSKQFYKISEVSQLLEVPIYTLHFWETQFPMFNPNRTPKGTRKYTQDDVRMAALIKELLYDKGMKIAAAVTYLNKSYRKCPPRNAFVCDTAEDAAKLLQEARDMSEDAHVLARIDAVVGWMKSKGGES